MLPISTDSGARLAAIMPSVLESLTRWEDAPTNNAPPLTGGRSLPDVRSAVVIVVDGLGWANFRARRGHARTLSGMEKQRIETVAPSTTAAALTTLTTGTLPGVHGLIGYRIRHPKRGLVTTLTDWEDIGDPATWQRATPLFHSAQELGVRAVALGRPQHQHSGLTASILAGSEYIGGATIEDRFARATQLLRGQSRMLGYLYIDELDRAGHRSGWESAAWTARLEQFDAALGDFLAELPRDIGVVLTADHGMVDVPEHRRLLIDQMPGLLDGVAMVGGEPRLRSLYLHDECDTDAVIARWQAAEGSRAWVATREEAISSGWFGPVDPVVAKRLGDVIIAARGQVAYYQSTDDPQALEMVGQHGSFTDEERGIPLAVAGAFAGGGFISRVQAAAAINHHSALGYHNDADR
jgi:hypothetical protein